MIDRTPRVAWLTNDLPPHTGGIQQFVANLLERTADDRTLVLGPACPQDRIDVGGAFDASGRWHTERAPGRLVPTASTARWAAHHLLRHRPEVIVVASLWPLGRIVPLLRRSIDVPVLGITHGAEAGLASGPARRLLRTVARGSDVITAISDHTSAAIQRVLLDTRIERLSPGVHPGRFATLEHRAIAGSLRDRWEVPRDAPVVGCVARLVRRKGQDVLLEVWPELRERHPNAHLVIVGEGPDRRRLARRAERLDAVRITGPVTADELPAAYMALDVFAMPVRTRLAGLDVEGLGISLLEAQAAGLPVVAGDSGGAPEAIADRRCGTVVDGRDRSQVLAALDRWLSDGDARARAGELGPRRAGAWSWEATAAQFLSLVRRMVRR